MATTVAAKENTAVALTQKVIGQDHVIETIVPYVDVFFANLNPPDRPAGIFLLVGGTGLGKTLTPEALAEHLHGTPRSILRVDCGEYQMDHEVSKLIGAPPGYLGHRETQPQITQQKLEAVTSTGCNLSIILFDEIEKAAPSLQRILLGILDKGILKLGDGNTVIFENTIIFMTSNCGLGKLQKYYNKHGHGFHVPKPETITAKHIQTVLEDEIKKFFSPEFVNRIDNILYYQPLGGDSIEKILELELEKIQEHIRLRQGLKTFQFAVTDVAYVEFVRLGFSTEFGARFLKRLLYDRVLRPLAKMRLDGAILPGANVSVDFEGGEFVYKIVSGEDFENHRWLSREIRRTMEVTTKKRTSSRRTR